jgi:hypothetical protein
MVIIATNFSRWTKECQAGTPVMGISAYLHRAERVAMD